jgi:hypothetical protein
MFFFSEGRGVFERVFVRAFVRVYVYVCVCEREREREREREFETREGVTGSRREKGMRKIGTSSLVVDD